MRTGEVWAIRVYIKGNSRTDSSSHPRIFVPPSAVSSLGILIHAAFVGNFYKNFYKDTTLDKKSRIRDNKVEKRVTRGLFKSLLPALNSQRTGVFIFALCLHTNFRRFWSVKNTSQVTIIEKIACHDLDNFMLLLFCLNIFTYINK